MNTPVAQDDQDQLTLDDFEVQILLNDKLSAEVKQQYLRLIDKLRAQIETTKERLTQR